MFQLKWRSWKSFLMRIVVIIIIKMGLAIHAVLSLSLVVAHNKNDSFYRLLAAHTFFYGNEYNFRLPQIMSSWRRCSFWWFWTLFSTLRNKKEKNLYFKMKINVRHFNCISPSIYSIAKKSRLNTWHSNLPLPKIPMQPSFQLVPCHFPLWFSGYAYTHWWTTFL